MGNDLMSSAKPLAFYKLLYEFRKTSKYIISIIFMRGHLLEYKGPLRSQKVQIVWQMGIDPNFKVLCNNGPGLVHFPRTERLYKGPSLSQKVPFVVWMGIDPNLKVLCNNGPGLVHFPKAERLYKGQSRWEKEQSCQCLENRWKK